MPAGRQISPSECALAVCLPLTIEEFFQQLSSSSAADFAKHVRKANFLQGAADEYYWQAVYAPVAARMERVLSRVESMGVRVVRRACSNDLRPLCRRYQVVSVLAHWRFLSLRLDDLLNHDALIRQMSAPGTDVQEVVARGVAARLGDGWNRAGPEEMLIALNDIIAVAHRGYRRAEPNSEVWRPEVPEEAYRLTRPRLEEAFRGCIRPGGSVELADGMHTIEEFARTLPEEFDGVLDLALCNSAVLLAAVKRVSPACTVVMNRYPADIMIRITLYGLVIEQLRKRAGSFVDAVATVHSRSGAVG
jgi:hypothetical protein